MSNFVPEFIESGETDLSGFNVVQKEAIIRERFKDEPWIIAFADWQGWTYVTDLDDIEREATDSFQGEYDNLTDYAQNLIEDVYSDVLNALPTFIQYNIDYASIARDMELGGEVYTVDSDDYEPNSNGVYVFNTQW